MGAQDMGAPASLGAQDMGAPAATDGLFINIYKRLDTLFNKGFRKNNLSIGLQ